MANEERVNVLIALGIDPAQAKAGAEALDKYQAGIKGVKAGAQEAQRELRQMAEEGRKLREVGAVMAASGAALIAPLVAAAGEYVNRYKGLEATANNFAKAQQRSADATASLGRVAAQALIPAMNKIADIQDKIAAFASAHPELVSAAVGGGAALVAGGGALIMAGTAISSIARSAELLKTAMGGGGLAGAASKATVGIAALAAGAVGGKIAVNALGSATGDARLKTFDFTDALKTGRQLLGGAMAVLAKGFVELKHTFSMLPENLQSVWASLKTGIDKFIDDLATGFRKAMNNLQKVIDDLWNGLANSQIGQALGLKAKTYQPGPGQTPEEKNAIEDDQKKARDAKRDTDLQKTINDILNSPSAQGKDAQYQADLKNLANFAKDIAKFADTGSLGPLVDPIIAKVTDALSGGRGGGGPTTNGAGLAPEAVQAYIQRTKALATSERNYQEELHNVKYSFDLEEQKALREKEVAKQKINTDFMRSEMKATQEFQYNELKEQAKYALERKRMLEDLNDSLVDLAAKGDVSSFIQAQKAAAKQLQRMDQDNNLAVQQRKKDFQFERQMARQERDYQLQDLEAAAEREKAERQRSYEEQLIALRYKHDLEKREIDRAFAEQIAALTQNYAGLNALNNNYMAGMAASAQQFLGSAAVQKYLQGLLIGGMTGGAASPPPAIGSANAGPAPASFYTAATPQSLVNQGQSAVDQYLARKYAMNSFDSGGKVHYDQIAKLRKGEIVLTPEQAHMPTVTIYMTVGDVMTEQKMQSAQADFEHKLVSAMNQVGF